MSLLISSEEAVNIEDSKKCDAKAPRKSPPKRPVLRGILKTSKNGPTNAKSKPTPATINGRDDVKMFVSGLRGEMAAMGVDLGSSSISSSTHPGKMEEGKTLVVGGVKISGGSGSLGSKEAPTVGVLKGAGDGGGKRGPQTNARATGERKSRSSRFKSDAAAGGRDNANAEKKKKSAFKSGGILERPMPPSVVGDSDDTHKSKLPLSGQGDKIEGFELDFDVVAKSEWKEGGEQDDDDADDFVDDLDLQGCSLAESIMMEGGRRGEALKIPGDKGWLDEEDEEGDYDDVLDKSEEDKEEDEEEMGNNSVEDARERALFLEVYTLIQNLLTPNTKVYTAHLWTGAGDWRGMEYGDVELQRREGVRAR